MLKFLKNIISGSLKKGFRISYSTGKPYDPTDQKRTDPIKDIIEREDAREQNSGEKHGRIQRL